MVYVRLKYLFVIFLLSPLFACSSGGGGAAGSITDIRSLNWVAPSEREDGSGLSPSEIAGYRIYYGTESGSYPNVIYIDDHTETQAILPDLASGTYYIVMATVDTDGLVSTFSGPEIEINY